MVSRTAMKESHWLDGGSRLAALLLALPVVGCSGSPEPPDLTPVDGVAGAAGAYQCLMSRALDNVRAVAAGGDSTVVVATGPNFRGEGVASVLQKLDAAGKPLWAWHAAPEDELLFNDVTIDAAGNIIVAGRGLRTILQPNGVERSVSWALLMKLDPAGGLLFRHDYTKGGEFRRVAVTGTGALVVLGRAMEGADFGGGPLPDSGGMSASVVVTYDAAGRFLWSKYYGDPDAQAALDVAADGAGGVIVAGRLASTFDFGGGPLTATPSPDPPGLDAFLVNYDASGNHRWSKRFGDEGSQNFSDVKVTSAGDVIAFGRNHGTIDFGGESITGSSPWSDILAAFDQNGGYLWGREVSDLSGLDLDASGAITLAGELRDTVDVGTGRRVSAGGKDIVLARFDGGGHPLASASFGGPSDDVVKGVALDPQGTLFLIGHTDGALDFGCNAPANGPGDFIVALAPPPSAAP